MEKATDIFFIVFHTSLILFNLFGWIFKPIRKANLVVLILTGASWFILGIFYGIGYCPFTDWHFHVLHKLGQNNLPDSYNAYLVERLTEMHPDPKLVDTLTVTCFFIALAISVYVNFFRKRKQIPSG
jgi:hypothetical protein